MTILVSIIALSLFGNFCINIINFIKRNKKDNIHTSQMDAVLRNMVIMSERDEIRKSNIQETLNKLMSGEEE